MEGKRVLRKKKKSKKERRGVGGREWEEKG
jgi:hypothetical protein